MGKEYICNAGDTGDMGSIPGWGRSPGGRHGNPLQYSCLENPMLAGYSPWDYKEPDTTEVTEQAPILILITLINNWELKNVGSGFEFCLLAHSRFPTLAAKLASLSFNFIFCRTHIQKYLQHTLFWVLKRIQENHKDFYLVHSKYITH